MKLGGQRVVSRKYDAALNFGMYDHLVPPAARQLTARRQPGHRGRQIDPAISGSMSLRATGMRNRALADERDEAGRRPASKGRRPVHPGKGARKRPAGLGAPEKGFGEGPKRLRAVNNEAVFGGTFPRNGRQTQTGEIPMAKQENYFRTIVRIGRAPGDALERDRSSN